MVIRADYRAIDERLCRLSETGKKVQKEAEYMEEVAEDLWIFWESMAGEEYAVRVIADMCIIRTLAEKISLIISSIRERINRLDTAERCVGQLIEEL